MHFVTMPSPVGELTLAASDHGLAAVYFAQHRHAPADTARAAWTRDDGRNPASSILARTREQLTRLFQR